MTKERLRELVFQYFETQRDFIEKFNATGGHLTEAALSKHLGGHVEMSLGWKSAYTIFFNTIRLR